MPIKPELRYYYPIDWPQISHWVRFVRAKGRCEACGRPHGADGAPSGRWPLVGRGSSRPGATAGAARSPRLPWPRICRCRTTKVVLAAAHLDHDPAHCGRRHRNVRALCQRCHLLHDRPEHRRRIRLTLRRRRALGDLFSRPLPCLSEMTASRRNMAGRHDGAPLDQVRGGARVLLQQLCASACCS